MKKRYISQPEMLVHNVALMAVASAAALVVLDWHLLWVGLVSLVLNLLRRASDFGNTLALLVMVHLFT